MFYGVHREDVLQTNGTFQRAQRWVRLGSVNDLSKRAAWKAFQPYLDSVNAASKLPPRIGRLLQNSSKSGVPMWQSTSKAARHGQWNRIYVHILPKLGKLSLTEINTRTVQGFVAYLSTGGRSRKTVENVLLTLSSVLQKARAWDYACGNFKFGDATLPPEGVKKEQRCFTDKDMGRIISAADQPYSTIRWQG